MNIRAELEERKINVAVLDTTHCTQETRTGIADSTNKPIPIGEDLSDEGVYYVVVAMAGTYNYDQLMSGTHPAWTADWTNGNKVAPLPRCDFESGAANGWIPFNWYTPNGPSAGELGMTVVRIVVRGNILIKIDLLTGTLAGQSIDPTHREIKVAPGAPVQGSINVMVHNGLPGSAIAPVAATPSWGDPATSYWCVEPSIPTGDNVWTVTTPANLVAPLTPGTYYIAVAMAGTYGCDQIMSGTHPANPADWQHGNLVAHLPSCDFESAALLGYVPFNWYVPPSGTSPGFMAMTSLRIVVVGPQVALMKAVKPSFSNLFPGNRYQLQVSPDLTTWTNHSSPFTATSASMVYTNYWDVDNWSQLFFRLQVVP